MRRIDLAKIVRSAARLTADNNVLIFGSQAILGTFDEDDLPADVTLSREADFAFWDDDSLEKSNIADSALGEGSQFDVANGYYGEGVGVSTIIAPQGWEHRLVMLPMQSAEPGRAWCLEPHDLVLAKLARLDDKDKRFARALITAGKVDLDLLDARLTLLPVSGVQRRAIASFLARVRSRAATSR